MNNLYISMEGELNAIEENNANFKATKAIKICQNYLEKLKKACRR